MKEIEKLFKDYLLSMTVDTDEKIKKEAIDFKWGLIESEMKFKIKAINKKSNGGFNDLLNVIAASGGEIDRELERSSGKKTDVTHLLEKIVIIFGILEDALKKILLVRKEE